MIERTIDRFNWWLPFYGALGAVIVLLPMMTVGNDIGAFLLAALIAVIVSLILLIVVVLKVRRQSLSVISMLAVFFALSWLLFKVSDNVHTIGRWLVQSKHYKTEVLAEPEPTNGEFKHMEWDGWGFAGAGETVVYLVFDPNDSLAVAARNHSHGRFSGVPCEALRVRRLESHWYTVLFYTDTSWDQCN